MNTRHRTAHGFSLIELMVALVVLSIGLLGAAKLFIVTLQGNASATSRMMAVNLVGDLGDRIRANRTAGAAYAGAAANNLCAVGAIGAHSCTPTQMAANDLYLWNAQVASTWPGGSPTSTVVYTAPVSAGLPGNYLITVTWTEPRTSQTLSFALNVMI